MSNKIQAIRGMNDALPAETVARQQIEKVVIDTLGNYGYREIRTPVVEKTSLFSRAIGEVTDIVEKEMYTFSDRNGDSLTLRPEGTASCVRACIQHGLLHNQLQRLWYTGPMFRHERPQKGRYRQFYQIGVEAFGYQGPGIDAELILMTADLWNRLGLSGLRLEINSLGSSASRAVYREKLVAYFGSHRELLDEDSLRRLETNPLRILDSKNPEMQELISEAPVLTDYLDEDCRRHFEQLLAMLDKVGLEYHINPRLVRGLDYYNRTVFEWITDKLGAQGTICAGGRFDGLVEQIGGKSTPAIGFALGVERLQGVLEAYGWEPEADDPDLFIIAVGDEAIRESLVVAKELRCHFPTISILNHLEGGSFKSQFKKADASGAKMALILAENEIENNCLSIKFLREDKPQESVIMSDLISMLKADFH